MQHVRILEIVPCRAFSSGIGFFGGENFSRFMQWMEKQPRRTFPQDFLFFDQDASGRAGMHWIYLYESGMVIPDELSIIDFQGGLYAVATDIDQKTDMSAMKAEVDQFLAAHGLERDPSRPELGNIITSPAVHDLLCYDQMDYYTPVKPKE